jgi:23S rRNA (cytidine1920-2'-O)/16S rRNA (cytidine1409-2'-O)-methyltransferase
VSGTQATSERLDRALVTAGLVSSRTRAHQLIDAGNVTVDGVVVRKASTKVRAGQRLRTSEEDHWVSRAAHKLLGALEAFQEIDPAGLRCLDAGASTGGFTQVLLSRGAEHVVAADVGHGQLSAQLQNDSRVTNAEGVNLRYAGPGELGPPFGVIVADLSFISLRLVVPALAAQADPGADVLLMVKPQFEIGRDRLGRTGVVTSPQLRREALQAVLDSAVQAGLVPRGAVRSPLPGQDGNVEFFLWAHLPATNAESAADDRLGQADLDRIDFGD